MYAQIDKNLFAGTCAIYIFPADEYYIILTRVSQRAQTIHDPDRKSQNEGK